MSEPGMVIIAGLGNPGLEYAGTRHNVGFDVVDELGRRHGLRISHRAHRALTGQGFVGHRKVMLVKPMTYMNLSGEAVSSVARYHAVPPERIWVVVDDVALPVGALRMRLKGSSGGHHGLESIESCLGSRDYPRIRIGIGGSGHRDLVGHVLSKFTASEREIMGDVIRTAADAIEMALDAGFEAAMNRFNASSRVADDPHAGGDTGAVRKSEPEREDVGR